MNEMSPIKQFDIQNLVYSIRGKKVMLDSDLGLIYGVSTSRLNEQVKRNLFRFPDDFMFQLTKEEWIALMSQNAISNRGGRRKLPLLIPSIGDESNFSSSLSEA